jgi:hypothetical protein
MQNSAGTLSFPRLLLNMKIRRSPRFNPRVNLSRRGRLHLSAWEMNDTNWEIAMGLTSITSRRIFKRPYLRYNVKWRTLLKGKKDKRPVLGDCRVCKTHLFSRAVFSRLLGQAIVNPGKLEKRDIDNVNNTTKGGISYEFQ